MKNNTVSQFASELGLPTTLLLEQLASAGVRKASVDETLTDFDKTALLDYLRKEHGAAKATNKTDSNSRPRTIQVEVRKKRVLMSNKEAAEKEKIVDDTYKTEPAPKLELNVIETKPVAVEVQGEKSLETAPKVFISYSYDSLEHIKWVEQLATMLRNDGIDAILDTWYIHPGDPITEFMETGLREADFVLIICTEYYKQKSDKRMGGVGYEEAIISSEILSNSNHRKYIPVLASEDYKTIIPTALHSKRYIDLSKENLFSTAYRDLLITLFGRRPEAPPIGKIPDYVLFSKKFEP